MKDFHKKFILIYILIVLIFLGNFNKAIAEEYEKGNIIFLNFQNLSKNILKKIKEILPIVQEDSYKEKYYKLLKQLAQIKLAEKEKIFLESIELIKKRYPDSSEVKVVSSQFGIIYGYSEKPVKEGSIVIDENWILVGKVRRVLKGNYLEIISLNYPNVQFNVSNINGINIGLAKTTGLGYIEINFVEAKTNLKVGDILITGGEDQVFPKGFLVGEIYKIENSGFNQKLFLTPLANFDSEKLIVIQ